MGVNDQLRVSINSDEAATRVTHTIVSCVVIGLEGLAITWRRSSEETCKSFLITL